MKICNILNKLHSLVPNIQKGNRTPQNRSWKKALKPASLTLSLLPKPSDSASYGHRTCSVQSVGTACLNFSTVLASPNSYSLSLHSILSTEFTEKFAVLANLHLLNLLTQTGTISGTVFSNDSSLLCSLGHCCGALRISGCENSEKTKTRSKSKKATAMEPQDESRQPLLNGEQPEELTGTAYDSDEKVHIVGIDSFADTDHAPPFSWRKLWLFTGPGFLMSIAFLDPGNLEGDLQSGAIAGYSLLWLLFWATAMGLLVQLLSARLGVVTGRHLAELCREEYPGWARMVLWVMAELALIGADIQEVIGSAIAIKILSNGVLPLWAGVIITASDCFIFLFLENYGVRKLEVVFVVLIGVMVASFAWMFGGTKPDGMELLLGILVPKLSSRTIKQAVGVVGCIIMPHNVFLHSALVLSRDVDPNKKGRVKEALRYYSIESTVALVVSFIINLFVTTVFAKAFYGTDIANSIGLVNAGQYLQEKYGGGVFPILYIWAIGLLAAGQSSTLTGTYAGQFIMGGFLNLRLKKWLRALITRSCAIVPTMIVALVFDTSEDSLDVLNEWLNVLQSIQIPFALIPLLFLVSKEQIMGSFKIGPVLKFTAWLVAVLVIVINGYLLVDFFSSEVTGVIFSSSVFILTAAYVAFIVYLAWRGFTFSSWGSLPKNVEGIQ